MVSEAVKHADRQSRPYCGLSANTELRQSWVRFRFPFGQWASRTLCQYSMKSWVSFFPVMKLENKIFMSFQVIGEIAKMPVLLGVTNLDKFRGSGGVWNFVGASRLTIPYFLSTTKKILPWWSSQVPFHTPLFQLYCNSVMRHAPNHKVLSVHWISVLYLPWALRVSFDKTWYYCQSNWIYV